MSRDIIVQDLPRDIRGVEDIPGDFIPGAIEPTRTAVIAAIRAEVPGADFTDPAWGVIASPGQYHIEANLGAVEELDSFVFHIRGGPEADALISRVLRRLNLRALDTDSESGLFEHPSA